MHKSLSLISTSFISLPFLLTMAVSAQAKPIWLVTAPPLDPPRDAPGGVPIGDYSSGLRLPKGYCIIDIATKQDPATNIDYTYTSRLVDDDNVRVGYEMNAWYNLSGRDSAGATGNGVMTMSVLIDKIGFDNCLSDAYLPLKARNVTPGAETTLAGKPKWQYRGSFSTPHMGHQGGGSHTKGATGALYVKAAEQKSPRIIRSAFMFRGPECPAQNSYGLNQGSHTCLGYWKPKGGSENAHYHGLAIVTEKYERPKLAVKSTSGAWERLSRCEGCDNTTYTISSELSKGRSFGNESEFSVTLGAAITAEYKATTPTTEVTGSVSLNASVTDTRRKSVTNSFDSKLSKSFSFTCSKTNAYQWIANFVINDGEELSAKTPEIVCTNDEPTPEQQKDLRWLQKEPPVPVK